MVLIFSRHLARHLYVLFSGVFLDSIPPVVISNVCMDFGKTAVLIKYKSPSSKTTHTLH